MRKMSIKSIGMPVVFLTLAMCKSSPHSPEPMTYFNIQGTVTDVQSGAPIVRATITLESGWGENYKACYSGTNDQGYYLIKDCAIEAPGTGILVFLWAQCSGYRTSKAINPVVTSDLQTINIALEPDI